MKILEKYDSLFVKQKTDMMESLLGLEQSNKYTLIDNNGNNVFYANEDDNNFLLRFFLKNKRAFTIQLKDSIGETILVFKSPFRFIFSELDVLSPSGTLLGKVKWKFSFFSKELDIYDHNGILKFEVKAPIMRPWTFTVKNQMDMELAVISKKWSGLAKEMFTNSDNFGIMFNSIQKVEEKALLLGAVFLIDFLYFERNR